MCFVAGKVLVLNNDRSLERAPGMLVEPAADHLAVLGPLVERIRRGVDADKALAVILDERHQVLLLLVVHVQFAGGIEHDGVEVIEVLRISRGIFCFVSSWLSVRM